MPKIDCYLSSDLNLNHKDISNHLEQCIKTLDTSAGACKYRAFTATEHQHMHCSLKVILLKKPHRDDRFMEQLAHQIEDALKPHLPSDCNLSIECDFLSPY
jgi:hypothetical protein